MKQKLIIGSALVLLFGVIAVMSFDLFIKKGATSQNIYEYDLNKFKKVDSSQICYYEHLQTKPTTSKLLGISIDKNDNIFVSTENNIIQYNANLDSVFSFKVEGNAGCIATGKDDKLYLGFRKHIEIWNLKGKMLMKWDVIPGVPYISSIAVDDSSVFIADAGNKLVHHFNFKGKLIKVIGKKDVKKGIPGFFIPSPYFDVLLGHNDEIWAINTGRHAFESYTKEGELITTFNKTSMTIEGFSGCCNPTHVAMLSDGSFVTSEKGIERVKIHQANGDFKCVVAASDQFKEGTTGLDIAVDSQNRIYVLDPEKRMIRIFEKK